MGGLSSLHNVWASIVSLSFQPAPFDSKKRSRRVYQRERIKCACSLMPRLVFSAGLAIRCAVCAVSMPFPIAPSTCSFMDVFSIAAPNRLCIYHRRGPAYEPLPMHLSLQNSSMHLLPQRCKALPLTALHWTACYPLQ